jgi:SAM-dependent methyltransferase
MHGPSQRPGTSTKGASDWAAELGSQPAGQSYAPSVTTPALQARRLVELGAIKASDVVCDLGCGDAQFLCELVRLTGCSAIGCDVNADALARGQLAIDASADGGRIRLTRETISAYMLGAAFQSATCVFVFLVPLQLASLTPGFRLFLDGAPSRRILSQRFAIVGLTLRQEICDEQSEASSAAAAAATDADAHGRHDYFDGLGAAFMYHAARPVAVAS